MGSVLILLLFFVFGGSDRARRSAAADDRHDGAGSGPGDFHEHFESP
jgi:hypothetical protein